MQDDTEQAVAILQATSVTDVTQPMVLMEAAPTGASGMLNFITTDADKVEYTAAPMALVQGGSTVDSVNEMDTTQANSDRYLCGYCQELFLSWEGVQEHMMLVHVQGQENVCETVSV